MRVRVCGKGRQLQDKAFPFNSPALRGGWGAESQSGDCPILTINVPVVYIMILLLENPFQWTLEGGVGPKNQDFFGP